MVAAAAWAAACGKSPNQVPTNPPLRSGANKHSSQLLAAVNPIAASTAIGSDERNGSTPSALAGTLAAATLQSQHVRIQT